MLSLLCCRACGSGSISLIIVCLGDLCWTLKYWVRKQILFSLCWAT